MRTVRVEDSLWTAAASAADRLGYRSVDVYIEDCLRRLVAGRDPEQTGVSRAAHQPTPSFSASPTG